MAHVNGLIVNLLSRKFDVNRNLSTPTTMIVSCIFYLLGSRELLLVKLRSEMTPTSYEV